MSVIPFMNEDRSVSKQQRRIQVTRPSLPEFSAFENEASALWGSGRLTSYGPESRRLEEQISWETAAPVYLTASGDMALYLAIQAVIGQNFLNREEPPEIITTPFTFVSTVGAIIRCNCRPVFADIDPVTLCIDPAGIRRHITKNTRAILAVHVYGNICDDAEIRKIAAEYNLKVIYDAAHAFGEKILLTEEPEDRNPGVKSVLTLGDASCCSLNATKVMNSAEGGIAVFSDRKTGDRFRSLTNFGLADREDAIFIGCNGKQDELRSALGICNMSRLPETIRRRRKIAERYTERLKGIRNIAFCLNGDGRLLRNYGYFPIRVPCRDRLCRQLERDGIFPRKYFYPLVSSMTAFRSLLGEEACNPAGTPAASDAAKEVLALPIYEKLPLWEVDRICDAICDFM